MRGVKREITDRDHEQLARWLRHAATSGDGMPTVRDVSARFRCGSEMARKMLAAQRDAGVITLRSGPGNRPMAQAVGSGS